MQSTYFDLLPDGVIDNIVRYFSERPRHRYWKTYISAADARWLLCTSTPLRPFARQQLTKLTATNDNFTRGYNDTIIMRSMQHEEELRNLVLTSGAYLTDLHLRSTLLNSAWISQVAIHCTSLRALEVHYIMPDASFEALLRARGHALHSLCAWFLGTAAHLDAIANYCTSLRKLELQYLRRPCVDLWKSIGPALQSLTLSFSIALHPATTLSHVQTHCRRLTMLAVRENYGGFDASAASAIATLQASYGTQLRNADMNELGSSVTCLHAASGQPARVAEQMRSLGAAVRELRLELHAGEPSDDAVADLAAAAEACAGLECVSARSSLLCSAWGAPCFHALFERPKRALEVLRWSESISECGTLRMLAAATGRLREVSLAFTILDVMTGLEMLVERNLDIERAEIHFRREAIQGGVGMVEMYFVKLLAIVMRCKRLVHFCISLDGIGPTWNALRQRRSAISDACVRYRWRSTFVLIGGVDYLA